ncbi:hypothetical protein AAFF_G00162960 [Aldrovandia affinis]|uniref:Uncharacterized protein n=1 Tax=Aldrovandia affinis TaxID=143900 RepID=A0AAD7SZC3_9TELE|nr:hypothetical protein AAFF_G00162960 [Aldrovandia affinis]
MQKVIRTGRQSRSRSADHRLVLNLAPDLQEILGEMASRFLDLLQRDREAFLESLESRNPAGFQWEQRGPANLPRHRVRREPAMKAQLCPSAGLSCSSAASEPKPPVM